MDPKSNPPTSDKPITKEELENTTRILLARDMELQNAYSKLEQAFDLLTEEKHDLQIERDKLSAVLSGTSDAIIALNEHGVIVTFNSAAERITGLTTKQAVGLHLNQVMQLKEKDMPLPEALFLGHSSNDRGIIVEKLGLTLERNDGTTLTVNLSSASITGEEGSPVSAIITLHNVSEEKQLEEMKLDFVSMAAHELRTPLTVINGYLAIFVHENEGKLSSDQTMMINRINIANQRLLGLVQNLLNVSKIERNDLTIAKQPTDWVSHVKQITEEMRNQAKERQVTLQFNTPTTTIPQISIDPIRMDEVLTNLVLNAITYTKPGDTVTVSVEYKDNKVVTHVADHGPGITSTAIPHLFTKFFRVSGTLEQGSKGTGLGLYIAKAIVESHQGSIWVDSVEGKGSTFSFALPAS